MKLEDRAYYYHSKGKHSWLDHFEYYHLPFSLIFFKLDCGIHPALPGRGGLPFFEEIDDPGQISIVLITQ